VSSQDWATVNGIASTNDFDDFEYLDVTAFNASNLSLVTSALSPNFAFFCLLFVIQFGTELK
jgi:hypothetical protein